MKKWLYKESKEPNLVSQLQRELNVPCTVANLLVQREIPDFDTAKTFFNPKWSNTHDPFLMRDMDAAITRIQLAIKGKQKILIYGDYDVDGTTAVSLVYSFFAKLHEEIAYYIPDRYKEGYGISKAGVEYAIDNGFSLIIALDCGIKAIDHVDFAKENKVDFIICDHHRPGIELPKACAVLDPKREDCDYPFKELCGCGIGFKLIQAYSSTIGLNDSDLHVYLDLVAIAIAADMVPINDENRILCYFGLKQINSAPRMGVVPFIKAAKKSKFNVSDLVFSIAPKINAAGRIHSGKTAVELLISDSLQTANEISDQINKYNTERRSLDKSITEEALEMIAANPELQNKNTTVLYSPTWHKGVIGIVASRLIETYYRPTIILSKSGDVVSGSARSVREFDVYNALQACTNELLQFGGHKYAAGLTIAEDKVEEFRTKFESIVQQTIRRDQLIPQIEIDSVIEFQELVPDIPRNPLPKLYRILERFAPFGPSNRRPVFVTHDVVDNGYSKAIGADESHLKLNIKQEKHPHIIVSGIAFKFGHLAEMVKSGEPFSIAYTLELNEWNNQVNLQLNVKDIRFESNL
ncbi:MAG: single-stranded-DNA-specific exonuclease RecJ [Flavobacteriales bacterium]|nr:single-stranded-DNA-specific exonuclease RecJ [Flavobacteriales bacterium]